jgi:hypothetical protein
MSLVWKDGWVIGVDAEDAARNVARMADPEFRAEVIAATMSQGVTREEAEARFECPCCYLCREHGANSKECACFY